jgi:hypothetical protein
MDLWEAGEGVEGDGVEGADGGTVAIAEASEGAIGLAGIERGDDGASGCTVVEGSLLPGVVCAVTEEDGDLRLGGSGGSEAEDVSEVLHDGGAADGAGECVEGMGAETGVGKGGTSGETASAAVGTGESLEDLLEARVMRDFKLLCHDEEQGGTGGADETEGEGGG